MRRVLTRLKNLFLPDKELSAQLEHLLGFKPKHLPYYQLALLHRSKNDELARNNERLEFLGDAYLGAIVAEYLFKKYPTQSEGYLTEMRSRIVRRETLNNVANRMGLQKLVQYNTQDRGIERSHIFGNALEALVGAVYLDQGYTRTRTFVIKQFLHAYVDVEMMASTDTNYKNQLLNWAQTNRQSLSFELMTDKREGARRMFTVGIFLNDALFCEGTAYSKKEAGQVAARKALELIAGNH
ncbi:ribonuclease III [Rurimicrobium arvi]|uniref:Ribonuclease 3 n=1 Tax=Rurimicrobium arvi TaxID=2049916 RepID=A0ABP8MKH4_9BACT